jgi:(p)ppGpp synthase/HD superfamily hydrolase
MDGAESLRRLGRAFDLAARAHEGQRRGRGRRAPYVNHVADVARRVCESSEVDEATLLAALLHDVVEKASADISALEEEFGPEVAGIVAELTDDGTLPGRERRRRQVTGAPGLSLRARRVRLADKASKMAEIAAAPPIWWHRAKAQRDVRWAREVVAGLRGADATLEASFDREAAAAAGKLGMR